MTQTFSARATLPVRALLAGLMIAGLAGCGGGQGAPQDEAGDAAPATNDMLVENGRAIAEAQCAGCHALGAGTESPRADAPPLTVVLADYDPDALADDFREGIHVGHPDMPDFDLGPKGVDAVLAYLQSINP